MTTIEQATAENPPDGLGSAIGSPATRTNRPATTASSRRAYERRQRRTQKISAARLVGPGKPVSSALNRVPFVMVLIALLGTGIAGVLYLNTMTDEAGMRASTARSTAVDLRLTIESLQRDVALLDATPRIAAQAAALGMVPAGDSAMLMVDGAGVGSVIGEPSAVAAPAAPAAPASPSASVSPAPVSPAAAAPATTPAGPAAASAAATAAAQPAATTPPAQAAAAQASASAAAAAPATPGGPAAATTAAAATAAAAPPAAAPPAAAPPAAAAPAEGAQQ